MADEGSSRRRSRSRSPPRRPKKTGGFRWKDTNSDSRDNQNNNRYEHRNRDSRTDRRRGSRSPPRRRDQDRPHDRDNYRSRHDDRDRDSNRHGERARDSRRDDEGPPRPKKEKKDKKTTAPAAAPAVEMIVVNVNDRLGSKTAVPCLPSDTVGQFKLMVAARIGREAGQIMLRRQGERPFKDHITLEDYGVSNGVQLDLEIDTGD